MALQTPLVLISGAFSTLPPGDTIGPATDPVAQASGNAALVLAGTALASGNAGISTGLTALASGNAGLVSASNKVPISGGYMTGQLFAASGVVVSGTLSRNGFNVVTVGDVETVTSTMIASGTIIDADVNISGAINATKLRFLQAGASGVARTVDSKLKDTVSVKDFGAVGDGATDDTAAIQAALDASRSVSFPHATYAITSTLLIKNQLQVIYGNNSSINYTGSSWALDAQLISGTIFPQGFQIQDLTFGVSSAALGGIYWRFSYGSAKNVWVYIPATNQIGWQIGCDSSGTGAYYNMFYSCNVQGYVGLTPGVANQKGWLFEVSAGGLAPNANSFFGGRTSQTKLAWSISGLSNRFFGNVVEGTESGGTCFTIQNAISAVSCGYNHIISPYMEGLAGARTFNIVNGFYNAVIYAFATSMAGGPGPSDTATATTILDESGYQFPGYRSTNAKTLDAYFESTWTPSLYGLGGGSATYTAQVGTYTQIGNRIFFDGYIGLSSVSTLSGAVKLVLPVQASLSNVFAGVSFSRVALVTGGYPVLTGEIAGNALRADLLLCNATGSGVGVLQASQLANATELSFSGHYVV